MIVEIFMYLKEIDKMTQRNMGDLKQQQLERFAYIWKARDGMYKLLIVDSNRILRNLLIISNKRSDIENILYLQKLPFLPATPPKELFNGCIKANVQMQFEVRTMEQEIKQIKKEIDQALDKRDFDKLKKLQRKLEYYRIEGGKG